LTVSSLPNFYSARRSRKEGKIMGRSLWLLAGFVSVSVSVGAVGVAAPATDADFGDYISAELPASEQSFMQTAIEQFPDGVRADILAADPGTVGIAIVDSIAGTIHYNRPEAIGSVQVLPPRPMPGDNYPAVGCASPATFNPGCSSGSGPYRRVYTVPVPAAQVWQTTQTGQDPSWTSGYSNAGTVTTKCKAGNFNKTRFTVEKGEEKYLLWDAGFSYLGGWSPTPQAKGGAVDAGLQYSNQATAISHDNYALFIAISNTAYVVSNPSGLNGDPSRIDCSDTTATDLKFTVAPLHGGELGLLSPLSECISTESHTTEHPGNTVESCETYQFVLTARPHGSTTGEQILAWYAPSATFGGWGEVGSYIGEHASLHDQSEKLYYATTPCGNCIFKWMTSIGQKIPHQDLHDKSTYGATWSDRTIASWATGGTEEPPTDVPLTKALTLCTEFPVWHPPYRPALQRRLQEHAQRTDRNRGERRRLGLFGHRREGLDRA
jgi:hypothetical protein